MSGGREIFVLLAGEDVKGDKVDLGVTVLAGLGGGHVDNLAGAALDHDEAVLAQSRALHGVGERRAGVGGLEGNIVLLAEEMVSVPCTVVFRSSSQEFCDLAQQSGRLLLRTARSQAAEAHPENPAKNGRGKWQYCDVGCRSVEGQP